MGIPILDTNEWNDGTHGATGQTYFQWSKDPNLYYIRISLSGTAYLNVDMMGNSFGNVHLGDRDFSAKKKSFHYKPLISNDGKITQWYPTITSVVGVDFGGELCTAVKYHT